MYINTLVTYVNELLAGENLTYSEMQIHFDSVIDDINSALDAMFPAFSEFDGTRYPERYPNYDFFPDKYLRNVVVCGAAYKFYITDEEGGYAAPQYERRYQQALFEMKRDFIGSVPEIYRAQDQGFMKDSEAPRGLWIRPGGSLEELPPLDVPNPDLRIYEGRPGRDGERGPEGRGIQNMRLSADRRIHVRYTDQTEEVIGQVDVLTRGKQGERGIPGTQGQPGVQGPEGVSGRSITDFWIDEANQVWIKYDRDLSSEVRAGQPYRIGQIIVGKTDMLARQWIGELKEAFAQFGEDTLNEFEKRADIRTSDTEPVLGTIFLEIEGI